MAPMAPSTDPPFISLSASHISFLLTPTFSDVRLARLSCVWALIYLIWTLGPLILAMQPPPQPRLS